MRGLSSRSPPRLTRRGDDQQMKGRTQWTLVGTAMVLGWGAGVTGATVGINDAEAPSSFGSAVTLDTAQRSASALAERSPSAPAPKAGGKVKAGSGNSPVSRTTRKPAAPRAVPAPPPRRVESAPRAPAPAADDSADSAESANSAD